MSLSVNCRSNRSDRRTDQMNGSRQITHEIAILRSPGRRLSAVHDHDETPGVGVAVAMQVDLVVPGKNPPARFRLVGGRPRIAVGKAAGQRRAQGSRGERHAGDGFEHVSGTAVFERTPIARQQQRRLVVLGGEHEDRRTKRRRRFDVCRGRLHEADLQPGANALAVDPAADGDFCRQRANASTGRESLRERGCAVSGWSAGRRRQLEQWRRTRGRADDRGQRQTHSPGHRFGSFCLALRIFLSMSPRSIESPSPASARVHATIASL